MHMTATRSPHHRHSLLLEGHTCWRRTLAQRATLLVDADEYYRALRAALLQARHQVLVAGWDFDTRAQLPHADASSTLDLEAPTELGELLGFLTRRRPELEIHVLRWDYHWFYGDDRESATRERLERHGLRFHDHAARLVTGCVHHKVVVIDDVLAFCGGIDLTHNRWDTCAHDPNDARREHCGQAYKPVHDVQLCVSGPAARQLGAYIRLHWPEAASLPAPAPVQNAAPIWPCGLPVDFTNIRTGISRTVPHIFEASSTREIEAFYIAAIAATERTLYIENQYFTSERIAQALAAQLQRARMLTALLVGLDEPETHAEHHTMGYGRARFHHILASNAVAERAPLMAAYCEDTAINVHSKIAFFDDQWLTIGSANLNHRSMGFDQECNLILEASNPAHRSRMEQLRNRLLGEHLGLTSDEVATALATIGLARLSQSSGRPRRLVRIDPQQSEPNLGPLLAPVFDRETNWSNAALPKLSTGALFVVTLTAAAFTSRVVAQELPSLDSLQRLVVQWLSE